MYIDGNWRIPELEKDADFSYKFAPIPACDETGVEATVIGGENLAIVDNDNVEGSWECVKSLFNEEVMNDYCEKSGMVPTVKTFAMDDEYFTDDEVMKVFVENMEVAKTRGPSPIWPQISQVLRDMLQEVGTGVDAETATQNGIEKMQEYIDK
jgi:multiple sugar transport system substrate-binding protein